jgi:hypothetical protein
MTLGGYYDTFKKISGWFIQSIKVQTKFGFRLDTWGLLGRLVYLALAEKLIEKLADLPFVILNVGSFSISFTPCVV